MWTPRPFTGLDRRSVVSATRCVMYRVTNGCCRQKSGACCARTHPQLNISKIGCRSMRCLTTPTMRSCARSKTACSGLALGRIDILYVHDIGAMQHGREGHPAIMRTLRGGGYRALEELRRCGVVRAIGIGVNEREVLLEAMEWGAWDAFLLAGRYTLLEQAPLDDLLPRCLSSGISIVVGGPLNSGILAGRDTWNYQTAPSEIVGRVDAIRAVCDRHQVPLAAAALQFPLAHPAVAAIIPGPRSVAEFAANLNLLRYPIPSELWKDLRDAKLLHPLAPTPAGFPDVRPANA